MPSLSYCCWSEIQFELDYGNARSGDSQILHFAGELSRFWIVLFCREIDAQYLGQLPDVAHHLGAADDYQRPRQPQTALQ